MEKKVLTQVSPVVLPWRVKILYAAGSFSKALLAVAMAAFMLYFYTDVCGIDSTVAATIILIAKIWDIINDPMMGAIIDRTRSKEGKCRFWLKYMSVPGMVIGSAVFLCAGVDHHRQDYLGGGDLCAAGYDQHIPADTF